MFDLIFTITVKSETTGRVGSKTIKADLNPDTAMEKFYEAVEDCLMQIAGGNNGEGKENSGAS